MPSWVFAGETRVVAGVVRISGGKFRIGKFPVQADTVTKLHQLATLASPDLREEEVDVNGAHAEPTQYLTVEEVCSRRKCSRSTLYDELKRQKKSGGTVPMPHPFKWGRRTYFVEAEVEAWLQAIVVKARNA